MSPENHDEPDAGDDALRAWAAQGRRESYLRALGEHEGLLKLGLGQIADGSHFIEYAFNLRDRPECPYTFPDDVRGRAAELLMELFMLWKNNKQRMVLRTGALVDKDQAFQRLMARALEPVKLTGKRKSR